MTRHRRIGAWSSERGAIAPFAAIVLVVVLGAAALSTDVGAWYSERRGLQAATDAAALAAVSDPVLLAAGNTAAIKANATDLLTKNSDVGTTPTIKQTDLGVYCAYGRDKDGNLPKPRFSTTIARCDGDRRPAGAAVANAVRLQATSAAPTFLSRVMNPTQASLTINTSATAARIDEAAFQAGTGVAELNGGIANALLQALLGGNIQLTVAQYDGLLKTDIKALPFLDALATNLSLTAGTYDGLLGTRASVGQIVQAAVQVLDQQGQLADVQVQALNALLALQGQVTTPNTIKLGDLIDLGVWKPQPVGSPDPASALDVGLNLYQLLTFSAQLANGNNAVAIPGLGLNLGPVLNISLQATAIEPPQKPYFTLGPVGAQVHTAQVRLKLNLGLLNLPGLTGSGVNLPIYIEVGQGDATLSSISCGRDPATDAVVKVSATSAVAAIYIGKVDNTAMRNFTKPVTVEPADLIDVTLLGLLNVLKVSGKAKVPVGAGAPTTLTFTQPQPGPPPVAPEPPGRTGIIGPVSGDGQRARAISTGMAANLGQALYNDLDVEVQLLSGLLAVNVNLKEDSCVRLLGLPLVCFGKPDGSDGRALLGLLQGVLGLVDNLLDPLVQALGLQLGYIDVNVTAVRCGVPVLVE
ncbi:pilus assembly protein TadG-related protein [Inquilinus sp.]|jgi:uncharacterized membrane protein|uniref:pilus assembly protein TadG-related protein n=1 Tax=Inquilinus sp. TaxID=1932117 RepID=UPI003783F467